MRKIGVIHLGFLAALLSTALPASARQEPHGRPEAPSEHQGAEGPGREQPHERPQQEAPRQPQAKAEHERPEQESPRQAQPSQGRPQQEAPHQPQAKAEHERPGQEAPHQPQARTQPNPPHQQASGGHPGPAANWQDHRARDFRSEHRTWQQRGGYHGYTIPDARFRSDFGSGHRFRMSSYPLVMNGGYAEFQYGGLWLSVLDPWPETWAANWYGNDDVYIGFSGGGYYLYNRSYPGDQIALSVSL